MPVITVVGGICADVIARPFDGIVERDSNPASISLRAGGVGFNIASRLAELGHEVGLVCALGRDRFREMLLSAAGQAGVTLRPIDAERSGVYLCINDPDGDMRVAFSDLNCTESCLTPEALAPMIGGINSGRACVLDGNLTLEALVFLAENVTVPLFADPVSTKKAMRLLPVLPRLFAVKPNVYEARALTGLEDPAECAAELVRMGCGAAFVSCGAEGIYFCDEHGAGYSPAVPVEGVTTGAGDAAGAMLLHSLLSGCTAGESAEAANRFAGQVVAARSNE